MVFSDDSPENLMADEHSIYRSLVEESEQSQAESEN